jgi:hypothetical protein
MRKSFYTLSGIVTNNMGHSVQSGDVFIFLNRPLTRIQLLHMECGGLVIYRMKLESSTFKLSAFAEETSCSVTSWQELMGMGMGIEAGRYIRKKWRENPAKTALKIT